MISVRKVVFLLLEGKILFVLVFYCVYFDGEFDCFGVFCSVELGTGFDWVMENMIPIEENIHAPIIISCLL